MSEFSVMVQFGLDSRLNDNESSTLLLNNKNANNAGLFLLCSSRVLIIQEVQRLYLSSN